MTDASALAAQIGQDISPALLERFAERFHPARVKPNTFKDDNDIVLFVHLPKTAGMSVGKSLQDAFDKFHGVAWQDVGKSFRQLTQQACYFRSHTKSRQVLMGHYGWNEVSLWKDAEMPIKCATVIRDPVARVISNYNYNCSAKHPTNAQFKARHPTIESFVLSQPNDFQLTKMIGMFYSLENAMEKLVKYYTYIGVTEQLSASLDHFSLSHGLPSLQEHQINVAVGGEMAAADVPPALRAMIEERNYNDMRLHALLMSYFS